MMYYIWFPIYEYVYRLCLYLEFYLFWVGWLVYMKIGAFGLLGPWVPYSCWYFILVFSGSL